MGGGGGTMNVADVLGIPSGAWQTADPISAGGPNQSYVSPAYSGNGTMMNPGAAPAISLVGLVLLLVAARVLIELGAE